MRSRSGQASSSSSSSRLTLAPQPEPLSDAETEPLPFSDDEAQETTKETPQRDGKDPSSDMSSAIEQAAAAASALVDTANPTGERAPASKGDEDQSTSGSDLSDVPDEGDADAEGEIDADADADADAHHDAEGEMDAEGEDEIIGGDVDADAEGSSLSDDSDDAADSRKQNSDSDDDLGDDEVDEEEEEEEGLGQEEEDDEEEDEEEEDEDEDDENTGANEHTRMNSAKTNRSGGRRARQERDNAALAGETNDQVDEEDAASSLAALAGGASQIANDSATSTTSAIAHDLVSQATAANSSAAKARKPSMLGPQLVLDAASDGGTSRQVSAEPEGEGEEEEEEEGEEEDETKNKALRESSTQPDPVVADEDPVNGTDEGAQAAAEPDTAAGTPLPEQLENEDDQATDEAALRRAEAMETLTKIEINFALLRDRLYVERIEEVSKESEMVLDGTHPELIHLTALIEARRQHRLRLVELWFEEEQRHHAKMAAAEEREAWLTWRHSVAELRRNSMDDNSRKRRKVEREKRNLDAPRPARRHQIFETELIGDSELAASAARAAKQDRVKGATGRRRAAREAGMLAQLGSHIALPDLRGLEDFEAWSDLERMGIIRPDLRMAPVPDHPAQPPPPSSHPHAPPHLQQPPLHDIARMTHDPHGASLPQGDHMEMGYYGLPPGAPPPSHPPQQHPGWANERPIAAEYGLPAGSSGRSAPRTDLHSYSGAEASGYGAHYGEDVYSGGQQHPAAHEDPRLRYEEGFRMRSPGIAHPLGVAPNGSFEHPADRYQQQYSSNSHQQRHPPLDAEYARPSPVSGPSAVTGGHHRRQVSGTEHDLHQYPDERETKPFANGHRRHERDQTPLAEPHMSHQHRHHLYRAASPDSRRNVAGATHQNSYAYDDGHYGSASNSHRESRAPPPRPHEVSGLDSPSQVSRREDDRRREYERVSTAPQPAPSPGQPLHYGAELRVNPTPSLGVPASPSRQPSRLTPPPPARYRRSLSPYERQQHKSPAAGDGSSRMPHRHLAPKEEPKEILHRLPIDDGRQSKISRTEPLPALSESSRSVPRADEESRRGRESSRPATAGS